tara:strand:- start:985 stop:1170 length:186 start_codon:yes stop_codon:yes gene_type:complete
VLQGVAQRCPDGVDTMEWLAIYGNGTKRIFTGTRNEAMEYAQAYTMRNGCGMLMNVKAYRG